MASLVILRRGQGHKTDFEPKFLKKFREISAFEMARDRTAIRVARRRRTVPRADDVPKDLAERRHAAARGIARDPGRISDRKFSRKISKIFAAELGRDRAEFRLARRRRASPQPHKVPKATAKRRQAAAPEIARDPRRISD